ncbi:MAG: hypothetical protein GX748_02430 [Lentisphaerae bacterium]|nr:hypothetical protein [Lentisphaerota bacterium]
MIDYEHWCRIKQLAERDHLNAAQIAHAEGLAPRTVRKWLRELPAPDLSVYDTEQPASGDSNDEART